MKTGDGVLRSEAPSLDQSDQFRYDPQDPVPTHGGAIYWGLEHCGPVDVRPVLNRPDVLYYRSPKLPEPVTVIGEVGLELFVSSSAEDTDFIARLCVEEPTGAVVCLTVGSIRCRYRESWSEPSGLQTNEVTPIRIQLGQTAYVFPEGSRISLTVTSSDFPRILPHPNTMAPSWRATQSVVATNRVHHGSAVPSKLLLPVVEGRTV